MEITLGKSTYVCDKNNISIKIAWENDWDPYNTNWSGIFDKNTMTLKGVFGYDKIVKFTKQ